MVSIVSSGAHLSSSEVVTSGPAASADQFVPTSGQRYVSVSNAAPTAVSGNNGVNGKQQWGRKEASNTVGAAEATTTIQQLIASTEPLRALNGRSTTEMDRKIMFDGLGNELSALHQRFDACNPGDQAAVLCSLVKKLSPKHVQMFLDMVEKEVRASPESLQMFSKTNGFHKTDGHESTTEAQNFSLAAMSKQLRPYLECALLQGQENNPVSEPHNNLKHSFQGSAVCPGKSSAKNGWHYQVLPDPVQNMKNTTTGVNGLTKHSAVSDESELSKSTTNGDVYSLRNWPANPWMSSQQQTNVNGVAQFVSSNGCVSQNPPLSVPLPVSIPQNNSSRSLTPPSPPMLHPHPQGSTRAGLEKQTESSTASSICATAVSSCGSISSPLLSEQRSNAVHCSSAPSTPVKDYVAVYGLSNDLEKSLIDGLNNLQSVFSNTQFPLGSSNSNMPFAYAPQISPMKGSENIPDLSQARSRRSLSLTPIMSTSEDSVAYDDKRSLFVDWSCPIDKLDDAISVVRSQRSNYRSLNSETTCAQNAVNTLATSWSDLPNALSHRKNQFLEPGTGMKDVPVWLKSLRLHKYSPLFSHITYDEMMSLTEEDLEKLGVTKGARHKIVLSIQKLQERPSVLNQIEADLASGGSIRSNLADLKAILFSPIRAPVISSTQESRTEGASYDIPSHYTRILGKVTALLLANTGAEEDCYGCFCLISERCLNHEAFSGTQKQTILYLKQQIHRIWRQLPKRNRWSHPKHFDRPLTNNGSLGDNLRCNGQSNKHMTPNGALANAAKCEQLQNENLFYHSLLQRAASAPNRSYANTAAMSTYNGNNNVHICYPYHPYAHYDIAGSTGLVSASTQFANNYPLYCYSDSCSKLATNPMQASLKGAVVPPGVNTCLSTNLQQVMAQRPLLFNGNRLAAVGQNHGFGRVWPSEDATAMTELNFCLENLCSTMAEAALNGRETPNLFQPNRLC